MLHKIIRQPIPDLEQPHTRSTTMPWTQDCRSRTSEAEAGERTPFSGGPEESETRMHSSAALRCIRRIASFPGPGPGIIEPPFLPKELVLRDGGPEAGFVTAIGLVHPSSPATTPPSPPHPFQAHPERCRPGGALPVVLLCTADMTYPSRLLSLDAVEGRREMPLIGEKSHLVEGGESVLVDRLRDKSSLPSKAASTGI